MDLPTLLRMERAKRQLDIQDAAKLMGLSRYSLSWIEKGRRHPKDTTLARIAQVYEIDLEELMAIAEASLSSKAPPSGATEVRLPLELQRIRAEFSEFEQRLRELDFEQLNALGKQLAREHREALKPKEGKMGGLGEPYTPRDRAKAATLYAQRILISTALQEEAEKRQVEVDPELVVTLA